MSCLKSPIPTAAEADKALYFSLLRVCDRSFFTYVESCKPAQFAALVQSAADAASRTPAGDGSAPEHSDWLKASIAFEGALATGRIDMFLPHCLARWLVASMLGMSPEEQGDAQLLEAQTFDGIGEFANMICGAWLTGLAGNEGFQLRSPSVGWLPADWNPLSRATKKQRRQLVGVNDLPMRIVVESSFAD